MEPSRRKTLIVSGAGVGLLLVAWAASPLAPFGLFGSGDGLNGLRRAVRDADALEISEIYFDRDAGLVHRNPFRLEGGERVREFLSRIAIEREGGTCKCFGDFVFVFKRGEEELARVSYHHGTHLRWGGGGWRGDQYLTRSSTIAMPQWLETQGYARLEQARLEEL